jgi:hypothetical protein
MATFSLKAPWATRTTGSSAACPRINGCPVHINAVNKKYEQSLTLQFCLIEQSLLVGRISSRASRPA